METTSKKSPAGRKPIHVIKYEDVVTSIFREEKVNRKSGRPFKSYSVSLQRSYYDAATDTKKYTSSLFDSDCLAAGQALAQAYHFIEGDRRDTEAVERAEDQALENAA